MQQICEVEKYPPPSCIQGASSKFTTFHNEKTYYKQLQIAFFINYISSMLVNKLSFSFNVSFNPVLLMQILSVRWMTLVETRGWKKKFFHLIYFVWMVLEYIFSE